MSLYTQEVKIGSSNKVNSVTVPTSPGIYPIFFVEVTSTIPVYTAK